MIEPQIVHGDARRLDMIQDESVDLIVTSPPYFGLRAYQDGGATYAGQVGAEATPTEFIATLIECTREWMRVLKPSGSMFVNLGDKYDKDKSLLMLPERYRIAARDDLGLIARAVIVWDKPNAMPASVTDRVNRTHEDWVHLTRSPKYYSAVDEIREPYRLTQQGSDRTTAYGAPSASRHGKGQSSLRSLDVNPLGKLPGSVWEIATQPLRVPVEIGVDHFAAFPMEWPRRLVLGWSPREVCTACGEGRRPVVNKGEYQQAGHGGKDVGDARRLAAGRLSGENSSLRTVASRVIMGYACACPDISATSVPGVVLDPFGGTGTTALVAAMHGRRGISVDASRDYCCLAEWRVNDPKQRERAGRARAVGAGGRRIAS